VNNYTTYVSKIITPLGMQAGIFVPVPSQDKVVGLRQEGHLHKNGEGDDGGGSLIGPDGVAASWMVSVSASVIFLCSTKSRRSSFLLALDRPGSPRKRAIKWLCVCACVCVHVCICQ